MSMLRKVIGLGLALGIALSASAEDLTDVSQIISKANIASYYAADDGKAEARMVIVDAQGNKQMRQFTILRKDVADEGDQDMLVFFSRPSDVKDTVFRVSKHIDRDDDRWLYLPALDLVKRISAGDKRTSFVGAHFYYEDVSGRNPQEDTFTLLSTDEVHYTIEAKPVDPASVEFARYVIKLDKKTFLPMEVVYYDAAGTAIRKMEVLETEDIQGFATVVHSRITNLLDGAYTEMKFRNIKYNLGLPEDIFSERSLRSPPKAWLD